jgi:hypothetical protein
MKIAVYTCITNNYDSLIVPRVINPKIDYLCFNDGTIEINNPWISIMINENLSSKDTNRKIKLLPHLNEILSNYDLTIYVDGSIEILTDLNSLIKEVITSDGHTFLYNHNYRDCIFDECLECYLSNKISLDSCRLMRNYLSKVGMEKKFGMYEAGVIIRKNKIIDSVNLMNNWWKNYNGSFGVKRDQIALMYTLWKLKANINSLGSPDFHNSHKFFKLRYGHKTSLTIQRYNWWVRRSILIFLINLKILKID